MDTNGNFCQRNQSLSWYNQPSSKLDGSSTSTLKIALCFYSNLKKAKKCYLLFNDSNSLTIWTEDKKLLHDMGDGKKAYKESDIREVIYFGLHCTGWGTLGPTGIIIYVGVVTEPTYMRLLKIPKIHNIPIIPHIPRHFSIF